MTGSNKIDISGFYVAGINYKKADTALRSQYAVTDAQYERILNTAKSGSVSDLFILSTCNRTEVFGFAKSADQLIELLCSETTGTLENFSDISYIKNGVEAVRHLFNVGSGLDSQILGDYEIISQIKHAVKFADDRDCVSSFLNRLVSHVIKNSKDIKNKTSLSEGTSSVSFAAIKYIKELFPDTTDKKVVVIGIGKIGKLTCKNLIHYLNTTNVTIINRSDDKAIELANELSLKYRPYSDIEEVIESSDIILVATSSPEPVVLKRHMERGGKKLIIDLSIPYNVEIAVKEMPGITLINVDELSKLQDETLRKRKEQIPLVQKITEENIEEFLEWTESRKRLFVLGNIKIKLEEIQTKKKCPMSCRQTAGCCKNSQTRIQNIINGAAVKMRKHHPQGCIYISAMHDFILGVAN